MQQKLSREELQGPGWRLGSGVRAGLLESAHADEVRRAPGMDRRCVCRTGV